MQKFISFVAFVVVLASCNPIGKDDEKNDATQSTTSDGEKISEVRSNPSTTPVANYEKKVKNDLNEWYFKVQLYETEKRFVYRMVMEYETINEEKEVTFPNLNEDPKPAIQAGSREYDAIVGFTDNKGAFKDYINVFAQDGNLRVKTLKYYSVTEKEAE